MLRKVRTWSCIKIRMQQKITTQTDNKSSERVEQFKYMGTALTNPNSIQEEIKSRLKSRNPKLIKI
jgi:hypothetical protein